MRDAVVDSSVALKWVITEDDTDQALALHAAYRFKAPDLLYPECANALWKLGRSGMISHEARSVAIRALQLSPVEIVPTRSLIDDALTLALELGHPAYDCIFATLARRSDCPMITADKSFANKMRGHAIRVIMLHEAAAGTS